jgi:hypothetical protein
VWCRDFCGKRELTGEIVGAISPRIMGLLEKITLNFLTASRFEIFCCCFVFLFAASLPCQKMEKNQQSQRKIFART